MTTAPARRLCSTSGLRLTLPEQDLPRRGRGRPQARLRRRVACDYDTLEEIALEQGEGFTFSYGAGTDASEYWRDVEENSTEQPKPMRALATILTLPFTRNESGSYAWPTAYSESPTEEAWQALVDAGLYSPEEIDQMQDAGHRLPRLPHRDHRRRRLAVLRRRRLAAFAAGSDDPLQVLQRQRVHQDPPSVIPPPLAPGGAPAEGRGGGSGRRS